MELNRCLLAALLWAGPPGFAQAQSADFLLPDPDAKPPAALTLALKGLRANALAVHINFLASPRLEGRGLGTRGLELGAEYLAARLAEAGLQPFGEGAARTPTWFQGVPYRELGQPSGIATIRFAQGDPLRLTSGTEGLFPKRAPGSVSAPLVFAGYGIQEPELGHDDFRDLDLKGKAVLFLGALPPGAAWRKSPFLARYAPENPEDRHDARLEVLRKRGAVLAIAIEEDFPEPGKAARKAAEPAFLDPAGVAPPEGPGLMRIPAAKGKALLARLGIDGVQPKVLAGCTLTLDSAGTVREQSSRNVLAILPGSDPALGKEAVVLGAHYDHLGRVDGVIRPGADDNASGVAALLEISRAFAPLKPRRTLVFAFWTGEEEGKFGSSHYVRQPRWPLARTAAYLNLDMIGHPWTAEEIRKLVTDARLDRGEAFLARPEDFIEPGVATSAPWLGPVLATAGSGVGAPLHLDWTDGLHGGSDYRPFARAGIPFVRFFGNFHPDYHQPGDTPDRLDPAQVLKITRLAFATAWLLADR